MHRRTSYLHISSSLISRRAGVQGARARERENESRPRVKHCVETCTPFVLHQICTRIRSERTFSEWNEEENATRSAPYTDDSAAEWVCGSCILQFTHIIITFFWSKMVNAVSKCILFLSSCRSSGYSYTNAHISAHKFTVIKCERIATNGNVEATRNAEIKKNEENESAFDVPPQTLLSDQTANEPRTLQREAKSEKGISER